MAWLTVLGVPAAVYVASMTALLYWVQGDALNPFAVIGSGLLAMGVYTFHRSVAQQSEHMQPRHRIAFTHRNGLHLISLIVSGAAFIVLMIYNPLAPLLILGAFTGIFLYGRGAWTPPIRNITLLKPLVVGTSIAGLAWVLAGMSIHLWPVFAIALICSADALLCDLEDRAYDEATNCRTLATRLGVQYTWLLTGCIYFLCCLSILYWHLHSTIGLLFLIAFPLPMLFQKIGLRTIVDFRPLLVLLLAWII